MDTKEHLNSLYAKYGHLTQGQDCFKSFDQQVIPQLLNQETRRRACNISEFIKRKEDMCAEMFKGMLFKNKCHAIKRSQKQNKRKKEKKRGKAQGRDLKRLLG